MNTLIFNRTQADVDRARDLNAKAMAGTLTTAEYSEWVAGLKGAYNSEDVNRVGRFVQDISSRLISFPDDLEAFRLSNEVYKNPAFAVPYAPAAVNVNPKTDWTMEDFMSVSSMKSYIDDVANLRGILPLPDDTPEAPTIGRLNFQKANDIEKILFNVGSAFESLENSLYNKITQAAAAGTIWEKYTCTREDREVNQAIETEWLPSEVHTDQNGALTASGYTQYRMEYNEKLGRFVYVTAGEYVTIREGVVYNVTENTAIKRSLLSIKSDGLQTMAIELRMVTTSATTITFYHQGNYIEDVHTIGFAYPDAEIDYLLDQTKQTYLDEPYIVIMLGPDGYYYYIRQIEA